MKRLLLDVIFASEKRREVLLLLQDGAKEMKEILESLGGTRQALLPQMRILEEHYLVSHQKDNYELTDIGKLLVEDMVPLLKKIEVLDISIDYLGTHNLEFIPLPLLERINELENCRLITPPVTHPYELDRKFCDDVMKSEYIYMITNFFHPNALQLIAGYIKENIDLHIITSCDLHDRVLKDEYGKVRKFIFNNLFHLYLYPEKMNFQFISFNEHSIVLSLLKMNGEIDHNYLLCESKDSLKWGKDIYGHYLKNSTAITEI